MYDFLVQNAVENVWCAPDQDMQSIIQPARLTPDGGVWNTVDLPWRTISLPEQSSRFHIYQIGQLNPRLLGLFPSFAKWTTLATACSKLKMIVDIYMDNGIQMPRTQVWFMVTVDQNLIIAVKQQPSIPVNFDDTIFIRFYTNAWFQTPTAEIPLNIINVVGGPMNTSADIMALQASYNASQQLSGVTYAFVNGYIVAGIDLISVQPGDVAEFVYDSSIYKTIDFPVSALLGFTSTLDSKLKYLLHYAGYDDAEGIEYQGDIDFFLLNAPDVNGRYTGVYYHRNAVDAVRMVTHKDYSVPVPYVAAYSTNAPGIGVTNTLTLRMHVRHSGYNRPLVFENSRIEELYKLPDAEVAAAMLGINATVPVWQVANLEAAGYPELMSANLSAVNLQMVQNAYGYNAISKILADTPLFVQTASGQKFVDIPEGLIEYSTAYEYDVNGVLLGYYMAPHNTMYVTTNDNAVLVEQISGTGTIALDEVYGATTQILDPTCDYRMYVCPIVNGNPTNVWQDVTGSAKYVELNNTLTWLIDPNLFYTMVRSNKTILAYELSLTDEDGVLRFSLESIQTRSTGTSSWAMQVPMGELDLFLNGNSLIENLDYYVNFPEVVICNKEFLINPLMQNQLVTIRHSGFCNADLSRTLPSDVGFIKYGLLSNNNRFDIRDDKVLRIVVDGSLMQRNQLQFAESDSGVTVPDVANGRPYSIRDIVVPLRNLAISDTYTLRAASQVIDKNVSDYMTMLMPGPTFTTPDVIPELYTVFSPFVCKIIYDLIDGILNSPLLTTNYGDTDVANICQPYLPLLATDPTQIGLQPDPNFVIIHPHNLTTVINVTLYQYRFLTRVVSIYCNGLVNISNHVSITS